MASSHSATLLLVTLLSSLAVSLSTSRYLENTYDGLPSMVSEFANGGGSATEPSGKRWAVLVAGSNGYENYRHQADVYHAYQLLKSGGLKDENIIVFNYDDIAYNDENPRRGVVINKPNGNDVYHGVPKDYTGEHVTAENFYAVLLGNKSALSGGSGKVLKSGPNDRVFIFYADHGAAGFVSMPTKGNVYAEDLVRVLKKMNQLKKYKTLVFYLEACESGSMFQGLLAKNLNIYAVTASSAEENSYATYCPDENPDSRYYVCLGDEFSVSWMEDSDSHDLSKETLQKQYEQVKSRTQQSHVTQYGSVDIGKELAAAYLGTKPKVGNKSSSQHSTTSVPRGVDQRDASLLYYQLKFLRAPEGSDEKVKAQKKLQDVISHKNHVDQSMTRIAKHLFGDHENASEVMKKVRPSGQHLVDDWNCFKTFVGAYEKHCGPLSTYGKKYARALANMCNAGVNMQQVNAALMESC